MRIVSRSNSATLNSTKSAHTASSTKPITTSSGAESHSDPVSCPTNAIVSGTTTSAPKCGAVRGSWTRDEMTIADCSETSAAAGASSRTSATVRPLSSAQALRHREGGRGWARSHSSRRTSSRSMADCASYYEQIASSKAL